MFSSGVEIPDQKGEVTQPWFCAFWPGLPNTYEELDFFLNISLNVFSIFSLVFMTILI